METSFVMMALPVLIASLLVPVAILILGLALLSPGEHP